MTASAIDDRKRLWVSPDLAATLPPKRREERRCWHDSHGPRRRGQRVRPCPWCGETEQRGRMLLVGEVVWD